MFGDERTRNLDYGMIIVLIVGVLIISCMKSYKPASYEAVDATIDRVYSISGSKSRTYYAYVDYIYKDREYSHIKYDEHKFGWTAGKEITVYVNPDNPTELYSNRTMRSFVSLGMVLIIFFIITKRNKITKGD